jgi:hypothetical protein
MMPLIRQVMPVLLLTVMAIAAACNDGDAGPQVTVQPGAESTPTLTSTAPTATPSPTPTPESALSPTAQEAPAAPVPTVDPSLEVLTIGEMNVTLGPGDSYPFDPLQLGIDQGVEVPPCAAFTFLFGWQVQDPYPPEGVDIIFQWTRMGGAEEIGRGVSGETSVGCGSIEMTNDGAVTATVQIRYAIAQLTG